MRYWIFKLNPERGPPKDRRPDDPPAFSWDRLLQVQTVDWDWVKERWSRGNLREKVSSGDRVVIYHTEGERAVKGFAEVVRDWQTNGDRGWVTLAAREAAKSKVCANVIARCHVRAGGPKQACVIPIGQAEWEEIRRLAGL